MRYNLFRKAGWVNLLTGLSKKQDKSKSTYFGDYEVLDDSELTRLWIGEGLGKKIISVVADDMTRNWISIEGDSDNKISKELTRLNVETAVNEAICWARLYRGSIIVVGANDGRKLEEPLANNIRSIDWLKVYSASRIQNTYVDIVTEPDSPFFEDYTFFKVLKKNGQITNIHRTRCMVFKGEPVPDTAENIKTDLLYWGTSVMQGIFERLKNYGSVEAGIANLMYELIIGVFGLSNLADILAAGNTKAIYDRIEIINYSKSLLNAVLLDKEETFRRDSANLSGAADIIDRFMMNLSAVCEIPVTRLFGRSPAGQNATGEADLTNYYDMISSKQKTKLKPPLQSLVNLISKYIKGPKEPAVKFNPVWEPTQAESIEMRKKQAETDKIYLDAGVVTPEEIAKNRFEGGYSFETTIESFEE